MRRLTVAAMALLMVAAACGTAASAASYQAKDQQQAGTCDGVAPPKSLSLLDPAAQVAAAVICTAVDKYVAGQGIWTFIEVIPLPAAKIPELVAGLTRPDVAADPKGACTASLMVIPNFVLTLSDGSRIRPGVPGDGCHPRTDTLSAFANIASIKPTSETRTTQRLTDLEATSNCGPEAKSPAVWLSASAGASGIRPVLPATGSVSICRYHGTSDQSGPLTAAGVAAVDQIRALWPVPSSTKPTGCAPPADVMQTPAVDWLMILPTPRPPYRSDNVGGSPIALLEIGGCLRLVDPQKGLAGYVTADAAGELAAVAGQPAK